MPTPVKVVLPRELLVIEDDLPLKMLIARTIALIDPEVRVDWAATAEEAAEKLSCKTYLGVLSDIFLAGGKTGLDLWEEVHARTPDLPFVIMSSMDLGEYFQRFDARSCPPFLAKPFRVNELADALQGHLLRS
jgi:DNA-binding NtrC family response regulator